VRPHLSSTDRAADPDENPAEGPNRLRADQLDPAQHEGARALYPYVLLRFLPGSKTVDKLLAIAVLFHRNSVPIIMIRHNWQAGLDSNDLKYLAELMDDWARTPAERMLALFRQLECLSIGPLRTSGSGVATAEALEYLMNTVLGNAVSGQLTI
jgi:hypothetical protein